MNIDNNIMVGVLALLGAVLVGAMTVVGSVYVATLNARRARERVALEANRAMKTEAYHKFMGILIAAMNTARNPQSSPQSKLKQAFIDFTRTAMIYGSPDVINAFQKWRDNSDDPAKAVTLIDPMLRAMREDLGESNEGIAEHGLFGLLIIGGPAALKKWLPSK